METHNNSRRNFVKSATIGLAATGLISDLGLASELVAPPTIADAHPLLTHKLTIEPITPENFAPFGTLLTPAGRERLPIETYGKALDLYHHPFESDQPTEWFIGRFQPRWNGLLFLERHFQISQTFIPIANAPFVLVVAAPDCAEENGLPALSEIRAFSVPGDTPIQIHRKTWHENPFPTQENQQLLVTAHRALIKGHIRGGYDKALDAMPVDLERRWYKKAGWDVTF